MFNNNLIELASSFFIRRISFGKRFIVLASFSVLSCQLVAQTSLPGVRAQIEGLNGDTPASQGLKAERNSTLKFGLNYDSLSANLSSWRGQYMQFETQLNASNRYSLRLEHANRFDRSGTLMALGWTHDLSPDRYITLNYVGTNTGNFWPISQTNVAYSEKWLSDKRLVSTVLIGRNISRSNYRDWLLSASLTYYAPGNFVYEGGLRLNRSTPGSVQTARAFAAVTYGNQGVRYLSASLNGGKEGYQLTGATTATNFPSRGLTLGWKEWLGKDWGTEAKLNLYSNPNYRRTGLDAAVFIDF